MSALTYSIAFEIDNKAGCTTARCLGIEFVATRGEPLVASVGEFTAYVSRPSYPDPAAGSTASIRRMLKTTSERVTSRTFKYDHEAIHFAASWLKERV